MTWKEILKRIKKLENLQIKGEENAKTNRHNRKQIS